MRKVLLLVASLLGVAAFGARAADTVVVAMKGPGSGNPFWAAVQAGAGSGLLEAPGGTPLLLLEAAD